MQKYHIIAIALFLQIAKISAQEMTVDFTRNEPYRVKFVSQIKVFGLDCGEFDPFNIQAGISGDYYFPKVLSLHAAYNYSYFGTTTFDLKTTNNDDNNIANYSSFEAGARLHFIDKNGHKRLRIVLNSENLGTYGGYTHTRETYTHITYPTRQIVALRGGLYTNTMPVSSDWNTSNAPKDPTTGQPYSGGGLRSTDGHNLGVYGAVFTNMHSVGFYGGISSIYIINTSYTSSGEYGGHKYKMWMREWFADVLYAPSMTFDPIKTGGSSYTILPNADGSFQTSALGWRLGLNKLKPKSGGISGSFEIGMRPGIKNKQLYFGTSIGFCITNRTKDKKGKKTSPQQQKNATPGGDLN